jgi:hypothetical protein
MHTFNLSALLVSTLLSAGVVHSQSQVITYQWLNQWCTDILDCDEGCMACNMPGNSSPQFFGTNVAWIGVDVCPHPVSSGDNAVGSFGWQEEYGAGRFILLSGLSMAQVQIDSIILRHARSANGPDRLKVSYSRSSMEPAAEVAELPIEHNFHTDVITDLGCLNTAPGDPFGMFQLMLTPYGSATGGWYLDEVRIVATPCELSTGLEDVVEEEERYTGPWYDVLGRPVKGNVPAGVYVGGKRQVKVF